MNKTESSCPGCGLGFTLVSDIAETRLTFSQAEPGTVTISREELRVKLTESVRPFDEPHYRALFKIIEEKLFAPDAEGGEK